MFSKYFLKYFRYLGSRIFYMMDVMSGTCQACVTNAESVNRCMVQRQQCSLMNQNCMAVCPLKVMHCKGLGGNVYQSLLIPATNSARPNCADAAVTRV